MSDSFAETIKALRNEKGLSQQQLADKMFISRTSITRWESGARVPGVAMLSKLAECLGVELSELVALIDKEAEPAKVIIVDDNKLVLRGALSLLSAVMPGAEVKGFSKATDAVLYAKKNTVSIAFIDIELGTGSGLDLCKNLLGIDPLMNVVFLTAYPDYALDAWKSGACGFIVKPVSEDDIKEQLGRLRHPVRGTL